MEWQEYLVVQIAEAGKGSKFLDEMKEEQEEKKRQEEEKQSRAQVTHALNTILLNTVRPARSANLWVYG